MNEENLGLIFKDEIYKIADTHSVTFNLYDLEGGFLQIVLSYFFLYKRAFIKVVV